MKHHDHSHDRSFDEGAPSEYEIMSRAIQELLEEKGVITSEQVRQRMEQFDADFPYRGPRVIAHAWVDAAVRARLLEDGKRACAEFGVDLEADRVIAEQVSVRVHDSNADMRYVVVPMRPAGTEGWSEERLAGIITRDALVGVTLPKVS